MRLVAAADRFQRRHSWAGFPLAVAYKYLDDQGGVLAALITYYGFLSIFPGMLLLVTVLGYVLASNPSLQQQIVDSAVAKVPVIGTQLEQNLGSLQGNAVAIVVGLLGLLYGVLGIGQAAQLAFNRVWAVPRGQRPGALRSRLRSFTFVLLVGGGLVVTTVLTGVGSATGNFDSHAVGVVRGFVLVASVVANVILFGIAFRVLTARDIAARDLVPGALLAAVAWQVLQALGTTYVSRVVSHSTDIYGVFGIVLGLFAWIYLAATVVVVAAEVNVVRACRMWPRSLTAPFTDGRPLLERDERARVSYVEMQRRR